MSRNSLLDLGYRDNEVEWMDDNDDDDGDAFDGRNSIERLSIFDD